MKANEVRIIGGSWRSRRIRFASHKDLRPTPDRVRETVFNWLGQDMNGRSCLDLFAGSGALGFEAASRGARQVTLVERDPAVFSALTATRAAFGAERVELVRADALEFVRGDGGHYDVIFLDPPFAAGVWSDWSELFALLPPRLTPEGVVYCESGSPLAIPDGWTGWKNGRAGAVHYQLLRLGAT